VRCLIVAEQVTLRRLIARGLRGLGGSLSLIEGDDPATALAAVDALPELAVVEWTLTSPAAIEFVRSLRSTSPATRIVIITSRRREQDVLEALSAGADDYLVKPVAPEDLGRRVAALLASGEPESRAA
jgi:two-component system response regulator MprA